MKLKFFIALLMGTIGLLAVFSCSSNTQTMSAKYYSDSVEEEHCQAVLNGLPLNEPVSVEFDPKAPQKKVTDSLWTDPCVDQEVHYLVTTGLAEKETSQTLWENICVFLPGPWVTSFVYYNGELMPSLGRPGHKFNRCYAKHIYLESKYSPPITLLVEDESQTITTDRPDWPPVGVRKLKKLKKLHLLPEPAPK